MEHISARGIIIGYTWDGHKASYPVQQDMDANKLPKSVEELNPLDSFGFQSVIGGILLVYPYKSIDGILYLAQQYTNMEIVGKVSKEDEDRFFSSPELWL